VQVVQATDTARNSSNSPIAEKNSLAAVAMQAAFSLAGMPLTIAAAIRAFQSRPALRRELGVGALHIGGHVAGHRALLFHRGGGRGDELADIVDRNLDRAQ
jgi:hypothetical protein